MRQLPKGLKRFAAGFIAASITCQLPLSASIAPLSLQLSPPIANKDLSIPSAKGIVFRYEFKTEQVSSGLDLQHFARLEALFAQKEIETEKYIPLNLKDGASEAQVTRKILQASVETWLVESNISSTNIGRSIASIQNGLSTEIISESNNAEIKQSLKFRIQPVSGLTQLVYNGPINASFGYDLNDRDIKMKFYKTIGDSEYSLQRNQESNETTDSINFAWSF
jgi:hypothetical protein